MTTTYELPGAEIGRTGKRLRLGGYYVPPHARDPNRTYSSDGGRTVEKTCAVCKKVRPHARRADCATYRTSCVDCVARIAKEWREKNWARAKLRDTWRGMVDRCHHPQRMKRWARSTGVAGAWRDYGATGVTVCGRWRDEETGLAAFEADLGLPTTRAHTLDRIENLGGYWCGDCPECEKEGRKRNARWVLPDLQDANRKDARPITAYDPQTGERLEATLGEWSRRIGIPRETLARRLDDGWTHQDIVSTPVDPPF